MTRGRHTRPSARGGGLSAFLAVAVAAGAVVVASTEPTGRVLRLCVVGLALLGSFTLLSNTRTQRTATRGLARTEERLRTLEQRNRDEGDDLHRRVLEGVAREAELRASIETLVGEIGRLRVSLESLVPALPPAALPVEPVAAPSVDIALIQRVLAAQEVAAAPAAPPAPAAPAATAVEPLAPAAALAPARAGDLWLAPARPDYIPAHASVNSAAATAAAALAPVDVPVTTWVVRELQLEEPGAAVAMRILDLTTRLNATSNGADASSEESADHEPTSTWSAFARPA